MWETIIRTIGIEFYGITTCLWLFKTIHNINIAKSCLSDYPKLIHKHTLGSLDKLD